MKSKFFYAWKKLSYPVFNNIGIYLLQLGFAGDHSKHAQNLIIFIQRREIQDLRNENADLKLKLVLLQCKAWSKLWN